MKMRKWFRYALGSSALGVAVLAVGTAFLGEDVYRLSSLGLSVGIALPVQWVSFALLLRFRGQPNGFLGAWLGGFLLRLLGVAVVAGVVILKRNAFDPLAALLGVAGLFFVLHLLEPWGLGAEDSDRNPEANANDG